MVMSEGVESWRTTCQQTAHLFTLWQCFWLQSVLWVSLGLCMSSSLGRWWWRAQTGGASSCSKIRCLGIDSGILSTDHLSCMENSVVRYSIFISGFSSTLLKPSESCSDLIPPSLKLAPRKFQSKAATSNNRKSQLGLWRMKSAPSFDLSEKLLLLNSVYGPNLDLKICKKTNSKQMPIRALSAQLKDNIYILPGFVSLCSPLSPSPASNGINTLVEVMWRWPHSFKLFAQRLVCFANMPGTSSNRPVCPVLGLFAETPTPIRGGSAFQTVGPCICQSITPFRFLIGTANVAKSNICRNMAPSPCTWLSLILTRADVQAHRLPGRDNATNEELIPRKKSTHEQTQGAFMGGNLVKHTAISCLCSPGVIKNGRLRLLVSPALAKETGFHLVKLELGPRVGLESKEIKGALGYYQAQDINFRQGQNDSKRKSTLRGGWHLTGTGF